MIAEKRKVAFSFLSHFAVMRCGCGRSVGGPNTWCLGFLGCYGKSVGDCTV